VSAIDQASKDVETLADLHRRGILTETEFEAAKNRAVIAATGKGSVGRGHCLTLD